MQSCRIPHACASDQNPRGSYLLCLYEFSYPTSQTRFFTAIFSRSICATIILLFYGTLFVINFNLPRRTIGHILPFRDMWYAHTLLFCCGLFGPVMMVIFIILPLLLHILSLVSLTYHRTILLLLHKLLPNNLNTLQNVTVAATITNVNALFPDMANSSNLSSINATQTCCHHDWTA